MEIIPLLTYLVAHDAIAYLLLHVMPLLNIGSQSQFSDFPLIYRIVSPKLIVWYKSDRFSNSKAFDFTLSNSLNQLCCCLGGNHAGDEVFRCAENNRHCISVWGTGGHREKRALFSPLLSCFLSHKRKPGNAGNIGRLLFYQHASLQPKAKLKCNTNEDEWLRITLWCTVVPRVPPTISFSLFSHFWAAKGSQGLALWRRWEFFCMTCSICGVFHLTLSYTPWEVLPDAVRLISESPCDSLAITCHEAGPWGSRPPPTGARPPPTLWRRGASAPSAVPRGAGRATAAPEGASAVSLSTRWPRLWPSPLPSDGSITLAALVSAVKAQSRASSVPSLAREAHTIPGLLCCATAAAPHGRISATAVNCY